MWKSHPDIYCWDNLAKLISNKGQSQEITASFLEDSQSDSNSQSDSDNQEGKSQSDMSLYENNSNTQNS